MSEYNFDHSDKKFIIKFFNEYQKVIYWKEYGASEYGASEWYMFLEGQSIRPKISSLNFFEKKIIRKMVELELLIPEIDDDEEYKIQRALGCVQGRIYYMPEKIRKNLKMGQYDD